MTTQPEPTPRIYNEQALGRLLAWEIQRATRYQDFLSLCLVRIVFPSTPLTVDVLDAIAHRVVALLRATDLVGVIEDTVAVVLVHTPENDAATIMERLRGRVEAQAFRFGVGESDLMPTLTLGLASFPTDATSDGGLLAHARGRLTASSLRPPDP